MKKLLLFAAFISPFITFGQLADGSLAPDFTLTDLNGNTHNLYAYLNSGKTVFVEIFAAHCPSCWNYHQTNRLKNMYNQYGPDGTDEIMVLALEHDEYNDSNAFLGIGDPWVTQGNWIAGTPYPMFNVEQPNRHIFVSYNVTFYPVIYKICPDKLVERVSIHTTETQLYQKVQTCQALSIDEADEDLEVYYNSQVRSLVIEEKADIESLSVFNFKGETVLEKQTFSDELVSLESIPDGIYVFRFSTPLGIKVLKLAVY